MHASLQLKTRKEETTWKTQAQVENNIKMALKEILWYDVDQINVVQDRDQQVLL